MPKLLLVFSFSFAAPAVRNSLPSDIRSSSSTFTFRRLLKLTASSRLSAPPSGSPKCLRFGLWLRMCTLNIYLLTYFIIVVLNVNLDFDLSRVHTKIWQDLCEILMKIRVLLSRNHNECDKQTNQQTNKQTRDHNTSWQRWLSLLKNATNVGFKVVVIQIYGSISGEKCMCSTACILWSMPQWSTDGLLAVEISVELGFNVTNKFHQSLHGFLFVHLHTAVYLVNLLTSCFLDLGFHVTTWTQDLHKHTSQSQSINQELPK